MGAEIAELLVQTVREPRIAARRILDMRLAPSTIWMGFALVVVLSAFFGWITLSLVPEEARPVMMADVSPVRLAFAQGGSMLVLAAFVTAGGRIFGGKATFLGALVLAVWLEFLLVCLQVLQLVLVLVLPILSVLVGYATIVILLRVLTGFVAEVHGFTSQWKVFGGIVVGFLVAGLLILAIVGPQMPIGDV
ncbi:YIP1 family protein [Ostreiculturibacter nitratireducens]|uniref:YIP1 family protein n=1 Tax=Ostreiculturibacter nitratireducens TaxID=3075226 RepID=UPI0031B5BAEB